ncbi:NUDIX hydrolase [Acinetobacter puyangensis]|uniref:NUDIX hydrolase n=1 Tax=Acinetobacter puyangensis TaxID=1096779 RepID=UPI003A4DB4E7
MTDLTADFLNGKLNIRVAAWIEADDHILVATFPDGIMSLPGGRLKFAENTLDGIQREILEETGMTLESAKLFAIIENFFFDKQFEKHFHELLYIYKGQISKDIRYKFQISDQEKISWIPKSRVADLKPDILQKIVFTQDQEYIQHFVNREY